MRPSKMKESIVHEALCPALFLLFLVRYSVDQLIAFCHCLLCLAFRGISYPVAPAPHAVLLYVVSLPGAYIVFGLYSAVQSLTTVRSIEGVPAYCCIQLSWPKTAQLIAEDCVRLLLTVHGVEGGVYVLLSQAVTVLAF